MRSALRAAATCAAGLHYERAQFFGLAVRSFFEDRRPPDDTLPRVPHQSRYSAPWRVLVTGGLSDYAARTLVSDRLIVGLMKANETAATIVMAVQMEMAFSRLTMAKIPSQRDTIRFVFIRVRISRPIPCHHFSESTTVALKQPGNETRTARLIAVAGSDAIGNFSTSNRINAETTKVIK